MLKPNAPLTLTFEANPASANDHIWHSQEQPLHVVMQEALTRHVAGVKFRERGAGYQLDEHMSDPGRVQCVPCVVTTWVAKC